MVGDMNCPIPANKDPCKGRYPRLDVQAFIRRSWQ